MNMLQRHVLRIYMSLLALISLVLFLIPGYVVGFVAGLLRDGFDAGLAHYERDNQALTHRVDRLIHHRR